MKFLFIVLIPFLVSINSISNENKGNDRIKCCDVIAEIKPEYLEGGYTFLHSMRIDMAYKKRNKVQYTLVADERDELKFVTHLAYKNIDNLLVMVQDSRRKIIQDKVVNIDEKRNELKVIIPEKGIYYLSFIHKDSTNQEILCGTSMFFIKKGKVKQKSTDNEERIYKK